MRRTLFASVLLAASLQAGAINLIQDGGFEFDPGCSYAWMEVSALPSWTVSGTVDKVCSYWQPHTGGQALDLNGGSWGTISLCFATIPGAEYELTIWYSGNPDWGGQMSAAVDVLGSNLATVTLSWDVSIEGNTRSDMKWKAKSVTFTVLGPTATLRIQSTGGSCCTGIGLDDISVTLRGQPVTIDVKPGSDPNCFNINDQGVVPVAILGSAEFDVSSIDQHSLTFGGMAVRMRGNKGPLCGYEDVNTDGYTDLVCRFEDDSAVWQTGDGVGMLAGRLTNQTPIFGADSICVVPR
jgi:hypothetical protein